MIVIVLWWIRDPEAKFALSIEPSVVDTLRPFTEAIKYVKTHDGHKVDSNNFFFEYKSVLTGYLDVLFNSYYAKASIKVWQFDISSVYFNSIYKNYKIETKPLGFNCYLEIKRKLFKIECC